MPHSHTMQTPPLMQQSRAKLWIRTGILGVFGTLFTFALVQDVLADTLHWTWVVLTIVPFLALGYWMRRLVPMHIHRTARVITFSFDKIYFGLILTLVIAKAITGRIPEIAVWSDVLMCMILGLMIGRLSGVCVRVHDLKIENRFN